jgi:hypothetical protein
MEGGIVLPVDGEKPTGPAMSPLEAIAALKVRPLRLARRS